MKNVIINNNPDLKLLGKQLRNHSTSSAELTLHKSSKEPLLKP